MLNENYIKRFEDIGLASHAEVSVIVMNDVWNSVRNAEAVVVRAACAAAEMADGKDEVELSVALATDADIQVLNARYRSQDKPTNVLTFVNGMMLSSASGPMFLGDVMVAYETMMSEARLEGKDPADHLAHLTVHGVLHLFGYDHETDEEADRMEALEQKILERLGVSDPYHHRFDAVEPEAA